MPKRALYRKTEAPSRALAHAVTGAFLKDFRKHGLETVERVRETDPARYLEIVTKLVPKQVDLSIEHSFSDVLLAAARRMQEEKLAGSGDAKPALEHAPQATLDQSHPASAREREEVSGSGAKPLNGEKIVQD